MEITERKIFDAIIKQLDATYSTTPIYDNKIEQNFEEPSFFIKLINPSQARLLNNRYTRYYSFDIHYFSHLSEDRLRIADKLYSILEYLDITDIVTKKIRSSRLEYEVIDEVLHFYVDYNIAVTKELAEEQKMEDLVLEEGLKDE